MSKVHLIVLQTTSNIEPKIEPYSTTLTTMRGCPVYPAPWHAAQRRRERAARDCRNQITAPGCRHPASPALQASFNEQIKHIIRKHHAVFVQPQQLHDKSLGGDIEHQMIFARPLDHIPDFDRPAITCGHDLVAIGRKRHRVDHVAVRDSLLAQQLQFACQTSQQASALAKEGRF